MPPWLTANTTPWSITGRAGSPRMPAAVVSVERDSESRPRRLAAVDLIGGDVTRRERRDDDAAADRRADIAEQRRRSAASPRAVHSSLSVGAIQRMQHIVGRDEKDLAARCGRRAADRLADALRPQHRAVARVDADDRAVAGRGIEMAAVERDPAAEAFLPLLVLRRDAGRSRPCPPLAAENADTVPPASSVKTLPSATSGMALNRPLDDEPVPASADQTLLQLVGQGEMAETVGRRCRRARSTTRWPAAAAADIGFGRPRPDRAASTLGSVMTAMRSPGSISSFLANGLRICWRRGNAAPPQPA